MQKVPIRNIYVPYWQGMLPKHYFRAYAQLKRSCEKYSCCMNRLHSYKPTQINLPNGSYILIRAENKIIKKENFSYPVFKITGKIGDQEFEVKDYHGTKKSSFNCSPQRISSG
jgi:hypothetical protein